MGNIPHSPQRSSNELNINRLDDFSFIIGTQPGQQSVFGTCYKGAMKCSNQVNFHTFVSSISDLMSQRYVEVKWIVINMAELLKIIQFGHLYIL